MKQPSEEIVGMINSPEREEQVCGVGKERRREGKGKVGVYKEGRKEVGAKGKEEGKEKGRIKKGRYKVSQGKRKGTNEGGRTNKGIIQRRMERFFMKSPHE